MNFGPPITSSELKHCGRFCFNEGVCMGCYRDVYGLAQCIGCVCPTNLWTGERCQLRIGTAGSVEAPVASVVLVWLFAVLALLLAGILIFVYARQKRTALFNLRMSQLHEQSLDDPEPIPMPSSPFPSQTPAST
ncbi:unnamed protein product [Dibothriocephalus latus]|uniref:Uncharacterized protein n=1 Tax=Dibothriocephalus latus TaxID=60516 RepID=A0A3P7LEW1_DIBLA|nr:unnamed protein product [Dibothriocephalus latus]